MKILVIGKPTYNIILTQDKYLVEGSKNILKEKYEMMGGASVYAATLLAKWGLDVTYTGVLGADPNGQKIKTDLENSGVNTKYIELNYENKTSIDYILINKANGSSTQMITEMPVNLAKYKYDFIPDYIIMDGTDMQGSLAALNNFPHAKFILLANKVDQELYNISKRCTYVVANSSYAKALTKMDLELNKSKALVNFFQKIKDLNKAEYVVTLKDKGVLYTKEREVKMLPATKTNVVDDTNAGAVFFGAYCYGLINGLDKDITMKIATTSAALSMQKYGIESIPKLKEVCNILNIKITSQSEKEEPNNAQSEETDMPKENVEWSIYKYPSINRLTRIL